MRRRKMSVLKKKFAQVVFGIAFRLAHKHHRETHVSRVTYNAGEMGHTDKKVWLECPCIRSGENEWSVSEGEAMNLKKS